MTLDIELTSPESHEDVVDFIKDRLDEKGINYDEEHELDDDSRVDIFYDGIVIEAKSSIGCINPEKIDRYDAHEDVDEVVLCFPRPHFDIDTYGYRTIVIPREKYTLSFD